MSLLQQIQENVVAEDYDLGSILLKVRLLAARLNSDTLEEWVKHESEGYPTGAEVPSYRVTGISYKGTFSGPFGSGIQNAPIPPYLIKKHAGDSWTSYKVRESVAAIDEMVKKVAEGETFGLDCSNLILLLQGKVYEGYACNEISGSIAGTAFYEIKQAVRSRVLELTIELERSVPGALDVGFANGTADKSDADRVQQISQQIIYGNVSTAIAGGPGSTIAASVYERNGDSLVDYLVTQGIASEDAWQLAEIMASEEPSSTEEPFGNKTKKWIASNLGKAASGTWSVGVSVATKIFTEAALKYYGLR